MAKKSTFFDFDMDRKEYLDKMENYIMVEETAIKSDKAYFKRYYGIGLDNYIIGRKFIIPHEMADLFCLMIAVMKSSPTYDQRKKDISLEDDIVKHNKDIVKFVGNLPPELADYIKQTFEYGNANVLLNTLTIVVERISALLHIALQRGVPDDIEKLVDGLDEMYERYFWELQAEDIAEEASVEPYCSVANIETSNAYHLFDNMLADLFKALDRDNWPDGTESTAIDLLELWKEKYKDEEDRDVKIKNEYLRWLCTNNWHVLHEPMGDCDSDLEERVEDYNDRYNKKALIHHRFLGDESGGTEREAEKATERMGYEFSQIKLSLQNKIDSFILFELFGMLLLSDLTKFTELLYQPETKHLSRPIFLFIDEMLNQKPAEIENTRKSLRSYISSTMDLLNSFDNMYARNDLTKYVAAILKGEKDIDGCCGEIYEAVFVKVQSQKCDQYVANKKDYRTLRDSIMGSAGNMLTGIIGEGKQTSQKTIIITPQAQEGTGANSMMVSNTSAIIIKGSSENT